jgi:Ca-activated chloride channel family protein
LLCHALVVVAAVVALGEPAADRCLSPYFAVKSGRKAPPISRCKPPRSPPRIAGPIAEVHVVQTYATVARPRSRRPITSRLRRAPQSWAYETLGGRRVVAQVKERGEARRTYEQAKADGKMASRSRTAAE